MLLAFTEYVLMKYVKFNKEVGGRLIELSVFELEKISTIRARQANGTVLGD